VSPQSSWKISLHEVSVALEVDFLASVFVEDLAGVP